ncbi:hypothetical protein PACTADRAFT_51755, partial [Pachysolen tannophilus NRRL Y-2460]
MQSNLLRLYTIRFVMLQFKLPGSVSLLYCPLVLIKLAQKIVYCNSATSSVIVYL